MQHCSDSFCASRRRAAFAPWQHCVCLPLPATRGHSPAQAVLPSIPAALPPTGLLDCLVSRRVQHHACARPQWGCLCHTCSLQACVCTARHFRSKAWNQSLASPSSSASAGSSSGTPGTTASVPVWRPPAQHTALHLALQGRCDQECNFLFRSFCLSAVKPVW